MKILVIFTGGTIACLINDKWMGPRDKANFLLLEAYKNLKGSKNVDFDVISPYSILSENLSANELNTLFECINENSLNDYDGIIVTHGSDTIQYTASALSFNSKLKVPIVLVCANYPLENPKSNGVCNFSGAVSFIESKPKAGVYISYKNSHDEKVNIHLGSRVASHMQMDANLYSIDCNPYAFCFIKDWSISLNPEFRFSEAYGMDRIEKLCDDSGVLVVEPHPGDCFSYDLNEINAVILKTYHSGTVSTASEKLKDFCLKAKTLGVPIFAVSPSSESQYESKKEYAALGVEVLPLCTEIALYIKCWIAVSAKLNIKEFVKNPVAHEFCG